MKGRGQLRKEKSLNTSGKLHNEQLIPVLKENDYIVKNYRLDGDAPKQFIKAYFYSPDSTVKKTSSQSWPSFIAKTAEKWYPHESITEFMINRIGEVLGVHMNKIKLVRANDQIRFLSRYFLNKNEKLVHGAEICGQYLDDMPLALEIANHKKSSRELFTFEFIKDAIRNVYPDCFESLLFELVRMITFDALVGNNDRHFYNWGIIDTAKKTSKLPIFAPLYDSARGLLWNESDLNCRRQLKNHAENGKKILHYIENAAPRISIEDNKEANHFQLIDFIKRYNKDYEDCVISLSSKNNEEKVLKMLETEFYPFFIKERSALISIIIETRFKRIRGN